MDNYGTNIEPFDRVTVFEPQPAGSPRFQRFVRESGNLDYRTTVWTWLSLLLIVLAYPGQALLGFTTDPTALLKSLTPELLVITLIVTILFQWFVYMFNYIALKSEQTGVAGIGIKKLQGIHVAWGVTFVIAANLLLSGLAWALAQIGLPVNGDIEFLVPTFAGGKVIWILVALTAGFCEEVAFRGYLMTRLRLLGKFDSWLIPVIVSAVLFGICHAYQGIPNMIVL
ncbi:MAG: CPBP family intramembrane metalloprotease, partial [Candidatus Zixiibacteriota bacterium]